MKKKTVFRVVLIVLCVLCTLSVLQVRNVLANHRQNERGNSTDDSFDEDSYDLVLPPPSKFEPIKPIPIIPGLAFDDSDYIPIIPKTPELAYDTIWHDLLYRYEPYYMHGSWDAPPEKGDWQHEKNRRRESDGYQNFLGNF